MTETNKLISLRGVMNIFIFGILMPFLPLLISRQWVWREAWVYAIVCILGIAVSRLLLARRHPDLVAERLRVNHHENEKPWDRILVPFIGLGFGLLLTVTGLDRMLGWSSSFNLLTKIIALIIILAGNVLGSYALLVNRFFTFFVRIQPERDHQVVSSGPYLWVRHPGYSGALMIYLATPFLLDSTWALFPSIFILIVFIIRTALEDRMLQNELDGYADYAKRVRFRLFPGVW